MQRRIESLDRVARAWQDPDDPLRIEALDRLPGECGLSPEMVAWGLDRAFEGVDETALTAWWSREGGDEPSAPWSRRSGHIWAGNVFVAGLPPVLDSLLACVKERNKAPTSSPTFASLLVRSLDREPALAGKATAAAWSRREVGRTRALLAEVELLFAFGDDHSVAALRTLAPAGLPVHGFGHRFSVAVITSEALADERGLDGLLDGLAIDHLAWDGAGCLSPRWIFVEGDAVAAEALARRAAVRLPARVNDLPAPPLSAGEGVDRAAWLARAAFFGWSASGPGWGVAALPEPQLSPAPPGRVMCFLPAPDLASLPVLLGALGARLQGVALAGEQQRPGLAWRLLAPLGLSRVAAPGALQRPPVDWNHDDVRILAAFR